MSNTERTFVAVKPDGIQRGLVGEVIKRFEQRGFRLAAMKMVVASEDLCKQHYIDLKDLPFYPGLCTFMHSGPVVAMIWEGLNIVKNVRLMLGETNPADSKPGSIRGDLCITLGRQVSRQMFKPYLVITVSCERQLHLSSLAIDLSSVAGTSSTAVTLSTVPTRRLPCGSNLRKSLSTRAANRHSCMSKSNGPEWNCLFSPHPMRLIQNVNLQHVHVPIYDLKHLSIKLIKK
uniref:nucleoside-diphosphate kinase n=1 Tax=Esox lucius TaxID=8010 RepID=A0A6Q2X611_ESOLU